MENKRFLELVTKHLSNEIKHNESEELDLLLHDAELLSRYNFIKKTWDNSADNLEDKSFNTESNFKKLQNKIANESDNKISFNVDVSNSNKWYKSYTFRMASSITILSAVILSILYFAGFFKTQNEAKLWETKITSLGQKSILTLIDGTVITLNANSELKYSTKFSNEKREVYLKGEAYFEVAHNPDVPFFVHSENIVTEVLGTKFNVKAFPNKNEISIALIEGKVKVLSEGNNSEVLLPNTQLLYNKMSKTKTINSLDVLDVIGWKDNLLKFNDEPLSDVFEELERTYGIKFELRDKSYSNKKIRAAFSNESFWTVVKVIEKATKLNYETFELNGKLNRIVFYE